MKAAETGKLKVYDNNTTPSSITGTEPNEIEPTCISDIEIEELQEPLWRMKGILEKQISKTDFWTIDEDFLLSVGRCIGDLMVAKLVCLSQHRFD